MCSYFFIYLSWPLINHHCNKPTPKIYSSHSLWISDIILISWVRFNVCCFFVYLKVLSWEDESNCIVKPMCSFHVEICSCFWILILISFVSCLNLGLHGMSGFCAAAWADVLDVIEFTFNGCCTYIYILAQWLPDWIKIYIGFLLFTYC